MKDYKRIEHMRNLNDSLIWERMKRCYDFGYEDGKADTPFTDTEEAEEKAYNRGLNDAWELVKRIESIPEDGGLTNRQIEDVFGAYWSSYDLYNAFSADEAMDLMKWYEDKQKQAAEIKVGDEITTIHGSKGIVITDKPSALGDISVWLPTCTHVQLYPVKDLSKTGRHFPQIAEVLKEMRGAENDE